MTVQFMSTPRPSSTHCAVSPALQKLLADCKEGKIDVIVVYKIDRLSRSLYDFADLSRMFEPGDMGRAAEPERLSALREAKKQNRQRLYCRIC
jgi:hypothetical protein